MKSESSWLDVRNFRFAVHRRKFRLITKANQPVGWERIANQRRRFDFHVACNLVRNHDVADGDGDGTRIELLTAVMADLIPFWSASMSL